MMASKVRSDVTMADVAAAAGVSRTTVSFVLNKRQAGIPEETRTRVLEAVSTLGYRPNAGARALASQRSDWIGLLTEIVTAPFAVNVIKGAKDRAWADHKYLLIASTDDNVTDAAGLADQTVQIEKLLEQRIEGLLLAATWHRAITVPDVAREVPTVLVNCFDAAGEFPSIVPDEVGGGVVATQRLVAAGHTRIGFITFEDDIPAGQGRLRGYTRALEAAGLPFEPTLVTGGDATALGGYDAANRLLDRAERPTALFCGNDRMAMGAYDAIKERGLSIPGDLAVTGFDNQELVSAYLRPALTTVALPFEEMGAAGVATLTALIQGEEVPSLQTVSCSLLERSSV
ncbi:LacI family DNA-binding transcriptional regulator [Propioniciclava soli]|uniref:LacI family DNA-binding transcriptional regulator n=1 Tax=Propioniciclava soli TaxID=2775081 RepID=UPI001E4ADAE8|nr:LacI family DNA-binding transcriptional regulator [Propioniciclava soli]